RWWRCRRRRSCRSPSTLHARGEQRAWGGAERRRDAPENPCLLGIITGDAWYLILRSPDTASDPAFSKPGSQGITRATAAAATSGRKRICFSPRLLALSPICSTCSRLLSILGRSWRDADAPLLLVFGNSLVVRGRAGGYGLQAGLHSAAHASGPGRH